MSPDNWGYCPRCAHLDPFGPPLQNLKEYYDIGFYGDDNFHVGFSAKCTDCDWRFTFHVDQKINPLEGLP